MSERLFVVEPVLTPQPSGGGRSKSAIYEAKLLAKRRALLAQGVHPATRHPLLGTDDTCGGCANLVIGHRGKFFKCTKAGISNGPATDIRKSWPACDLFRKD